MNLKRLFRQQSFKVAAFTVIAVALVITGLLVYIFTSYRNSVEEEAYKQIENKAAEYANWIKMQIEKPLISSRDLADAAIAMKRLGKPDRALMGEYIKRMLENNPDYLSTWITFELNGFDGKDSLFKDTLFSNEIGRFEPCFYRVGNKIESSVTSEADASNADYFNIPKATLQETIIEPYMYSYTEREDDKIFMTSTTVPIIYNGVFIGAAGIDISMSALQAENNKVKLYDSGFGKLISNKGNVICHPDESQIGKLSPELNGPNGTIIKEAIEKGKFLSIDDKSVKLGKTARKVFVPVRFGNCPTPWSYAVVVPADEITARVNASIRNAIIISVLGSILLVVIIILLFRPISRLLKSVTSILNALAKGETNINHSLDIEKDNEIGEMARAVNELVNGLKEKAEFARRIGRGDLTADYKPLSEKDEMGIALLEMRESLHKAEEEEKIRKKEDDQRNWVTQGIAKFADILRKNNSDMEALSFEIIKELVKYMGMNQGGLFILNDDDKNHPFLELKACYAYNRQKYLTKHIEIGEGLVGACFQEGLTIYLTEVPQNYVNITSGLGEATPNCILIVPLKLNDEIYGIIELASFTELEKYQIEFVEKVAESIASTISSVKINIRTAYLLEKSQQQAEEMRAQEEEMRQNMEELQATQEEMARKNAEIQSVMTGINTALPFIEFDASERVINLNDLFTELTGLKLNDIKGMSHRSLLPQEYYESGKYNELWSKLRMGIPITEEFVHNLATGTLYTKETLTPIRDKDGNVSKVMMFIVDMTEQKKLEQEIKQKLVEAKEMEEEMRQNLEELQTTQEELARRAKEQKEKDEAIKKKYEEEMLQLQMTLLQQQEESEKELKKRLKEQEEELRAQEEELRQNLEELQATQEELARRAKEQKEKDEAIKKKYEEEMINLQMTLLQQQEESEKKLKEKLLEQETELVQKTEEIRSQLEQMEKMQKQIKAKNQELEDFKEAMLEESKAQKEMLEAQLEQTRKELEEARRIIDELRNQNQQ